jgi:hypothetical protein
MTDRMCMIVNLCRARVNASHPHKNNWSATWRNTEQPMPTVLSLLLAITVDRRCRSHTASQEGSTG